MEDESPKSRHQIYYEKNREKCIQKSLSWRKNNPEKHAAIIKGLASKVAAYSRKYYLANKEKRIQYTKEWRKRNPDRYELQRKEWTELNRERVREYDRKRRVANQVEYRERDRKRLPKKVEQMRQWRAANPGRSLAIGKASRDRLKAQAITAYGGKCRCCGESNSVFMTIDHINNDGKEHRKRTGSSKQIYAELRLQGWPDYVRLLCFNCNLGRAINGGICPHENESTNAFALAGVC